MCVSMFMCVFVGVRYTIPLQPLMMIHAVSRLQGCPLYSTVRGAYMPPVRHVLPEVQSLGIRRL